MERDPWVRSSRCEAGSCVEVQVTDGLVRVRDSKMPDREPFEFSSGVWAGFLEDAAGGKFATAAA